VLAVCGRELFFYNHETVIITKMEKFYEYKNVVGVGNEK